MVLTRVGAGHLADLLISLSTVSSPTTESKALSCFKPL